MSRVALIGENSIGYINALVDIWNNGDCAVLLDWRIPFQTAIQMINEADVSKCYIEDTLLQKIDIIPDDIYFIAFSKDNTHAEYLPEYIYDKFKENYTHSEAVVIYSSGTTGKAKGVVLSHYAINTNADAIIDYMQPTIEDCIYIVKTLSHSSTLTGELLVALKTQTKLVVAPVIVPPRVIMSNIEKYKVSILCLNPTLLSMITDWQNRSASDISSLRTIYVSGSILNEKICNEAHNTFLETPIYNVYGLSEAGPRVTAQRKDCCTGNSVGKPIKDIEIAIVDEDGVVSPCGKKGIVHVKTASQYDKYVVGEGKFKSLYKDWLNTGDIGYLDEKGELYIVGRTDDVIIIDSHKIYPSEIEKLILAHTQVKECVVTSIENNNKKIIACLYVSDIDLETEIKDILRNSVMLYEIPKMFVKTKVIPKIINGKYNISQIVYVVKRGIKNEQCV